MMCLCHGLLLWKEKKICLNVFTAARTLSPSSNSPGALKSSLQQSDSQQNPYQNHLLIWEEEFFTTQELLVTKGKHNMTGRHRSCQGQTAKDCIVTQDFGTANLKDDTPNGKGSLHNQSRQQTDFSCGSWQWAIRILLSII